MISTSAYSPTTIIQERNPRLSEENRNRLLPTISHLSDLMWMAWNTVSSDPRELRYLAIDKVRNDDTLAVMDYLFLRDKKDNRNIPWPGLEYRGDSEEGKVLLATPNGRATAWLLINHAQRLKGSGELKVNIFSVFGDYGMLWDLNPQSPVGRSRRGTHIERRIRHDAHAEAPSKTQPHGSIQPDSQPLTWYLLPSNGSLVKRATSEEIYEIAKCSGLARLEKIKSAVGGHETPGKEFHMSDLNNGWTGTHWTLGLEPQWHQYFDKQLGEGKVPPEDVIELVTLRQDEEFTTVNGGLKPVS